MTINLQKFFLLTVGLLFFILGCARDRTEVLIPDHVSPPMDVHETDDVAKASFEHDLLPILTARCALSGCHVADGPHGLDFRTYESFLAGGEHGPAFVPGNAQDSEIVEQIVSGTMPPGGPPLSAAEIKLFVDWINQQEAQDGGVKHAHGDEHAVEEVIPEDMGDAHEDDDDAHDEDMDDDHGDVHDDHDDDAQ
ncbi:MAG: hypothetical protein OXH39_01415 [Candidatus Poribacteria bacterium]|nr:hypothetical protein [Candidatus Poribacteria bacterium]